MSESSNETADIPRITDLPADERQSLLAVERRWLALDILMGKTTPVGLEELAAGIAAREDGSDAADEGTIERVAITLHHTHLPRMAEVGVLDYDPESRRIDPDGTLHSSRSGTTIPSTDELVAFADRHCRLVLEYLVKNERTTLEELRTELADEDTRAVDAPAETIPTKLHHNYLPRLDDADLIHYDPDDQTVEATERLTGQITDLLDDAQEA